MLSRFTYTPSMDETAFCDACGNFVPVSYCDDCNEAQCDYCLSAYGCDCE